MRRFRAMDRLALMGDFVRIVETGSLSAAARAARTTQPTLSKRLQSLEGALGVRLLQRTTRGIQLTDAGRRYFAACKRVLDDIAQVEAELGGLRRELTGTLRLGFPVALGEEHLTRIALEFHRMHPGLELDLDLSNRSAEFVERGVDLMVRIGVALDPTVVARILGGYSYVLVATPQYLEQRGAPREPAELSSHRYLRYGGEESEPLITAAGPVAVDIHSPVSINNLLALKTAVLLGAGIGRIPRWLVEADVKAGRLAIVLPGIAPAPMPVHVAYLPSRYVPEKIRAFVRHLVSSVWSIPGWVGPDALPPALSEPAHF